jgi:hypothetical protein
MAQLRSAGIEAKADKPVVADPSMCRSTGSPGAHTTKAC